MNDMIFDRDYSALLMSAMPNTSTPGAEIEVQLSVAPQSETGFLIIDLGDMVREEVLFYHRKSGASVYVYGINRSNPISHDANANVLLTNSIDALNFLSENTFQQMFIFKTSDKELLVQGGKFYIDGITVEIDNLNTLDAIVGKVLTNSSMNFITVKDGDYNISTTYDSGLYQIAEVAVNGSGVITSIERNKVFSLSGKTLSQSEIDKLASIEDNAEVNVQSDYNEINPLEDSFILNKPDLSIYELTTNKTGTIGGTGSTFKYPTTKAVRDELNLKVDIVPGKDLSDNNLTDALIDTINDKVDKDGVKVLTDNNFSDLDKDKLDNLVQFGGIDFISGNNVSIQTVTDILGHKDVTIKAFTNVNLGTQSNQMMDISPVENGSNGAYYEYGEWDRYIVLKDLGVNGFDGKVLTPLDADAINGLRVYAKNEGVAGQLKLQILIRVTDSLGDMMDTIRSIPFNANIGVGESYFDIPLIQFAGLNITNSNNVYFKIIRDASRSIKPNRDTVDGKVLVSAAVVDFNIPASAIPAIPTHNYDIAGDSTTGNDSYIVNISLGSVLEDGLLLPFVTDVNNTGAATLNYNSSGVKAIVDFNGIPLVSDQIQAEQLTFVRYDLANDRYVLLGTTASIPTVISAVKHTQLIGDGILTSIPVTHALGQYVIAQAFLEATGELIECEVTLTNATTTTFTFVTAPLLNEVRVVIIG